MAQLPRDSSRPFATPPAFRPPLEVEPPPLRFDADSPADAADADDDAAIEGYRSPRASRWRALRAPLAFTLCVAGLIAATWLAWTPVLDAVAEGASALAGREGDERTRPTVTVALGALAVLGFVLAWWRGTHPRRAVRLSGDRGRMAVDAIGGRIRASLLEMEEVREAEVGVENRGRGRVRVRAWIRISPEARIDDVLDGVDDAAERLVQDRLGLRLSEPPLADVRYDELDLRAGRAATLRARSHDMAHDMAHDSAHHLAHDTGGALPVGRAVDDGDA